MEDVGQEECEGQGKDGGEERMEGRRGWRIWKGLRVGLNEGHGEVAE